MVKQAQTMEGKPMSRIEVVRDGKKRWKVMVNYVKRGVSVTSPLLANKEATAIKDKELPHAELHLIDA
jgi:hypothetical protein